MDLQSLYKGKRILVTGGAGYIGSLLINQLVTYDTKIDVLVLNAADVKELPWANNSAVKVIEQDLSEIKDWRSLLDNVDIIFHFAAQTSHYKANSSPTYDWEISVQPLLNLCTSLRGIENRPRLIYAS